MFSRTPGPRAGSLSKPKGSPGLISFLPLLVLLMVISSVMGGLACQKDSECRRSVCIFEQCKPRPTTGGTCQVNNHCLKAPTEACITNVCSAKSNTGSDCDENADCAVAGDKCSVEQTCYTPLDTSLLEWEGNKAINVPRTSSAGVAVGNDLFVIAGYDSFTDSPTNSVVKYNSLTNTWEEKTPVPVGVTDPSLVAIGPLVFIIGGKDASQATTTFFSYNTVNDQWDETWNQLPKGIFRAAAAVVGTTIYLFGGTDGSDTPLNTILSIDTSNKQNQWIESSTAFLAAGNVLLTANTVGTDIYIVGGITLNTGTITKVYKYNTLEPEISPVDIGKDMLERRFYHLSFYDSDNNRLYAVGGTILGTPNAAEYLDLGDSSAVWTSANAPTFLTLFSKTGGLIGSKFYIASSSFSPVTLQVLDVSNPQKVVWSPFPNSPSPKATIAQLTGPSEITLVSTLDTSIAFYDISSKSWKAGTVIQQLPGSRPFAASAAPKGVIHVMGGENGGNAQTSVYQFGRTNGWITSSNLLPSPRTRSCAAASDTQIFLYGGVSTLNGAPDNSLFVSNLDANGRSTTWTQIDNNLSSTQPTGVTFCAAVVANGKLLIFGGGTESAGASPTGLIQSFDISSGRWDSPHSSSITPRSYLSAVLLKDYVFIIGGTSDGSATGALNKVEAFDTKAPFSSTSAVRAIKDMPTPRFNLGSVTDGSSIFSIGGQTTDLANFPSLERLYFKR